jgi:hypothetical protein
MQQTLNFMDEQFLITLESLKHPKIKIINKAIKKQTQLFELDSPIDIQFNGYYTLTEYQSFLDSLFQKCKVELQKMRSIANNQFQKLKDQFNNLLLELRLLRKRFYPMNDLDLMFSRIELQKGSLPIDNNHQYLKKN